MTSWLNSRDSDARRAERRIVEEHVVRSSRRGLADLEGAHRGGAQRDAGCGQCGHNRSVEPHADPPAGDVDVQLEDVPPGARGGNTYGVEVGRVVVECE